MKTEYTFERIINLGSNELSQQLAGKKDEFLQLIEEELHVEIRARGVELVVLGSEEAVQMASLVIHNLAQIAPAIQEHDVLYAVKLAQEKSETTLKQISKEVVVSTWRGKEIRPKTEGQRKYVQMLKENVIVFGIGPAGTGKTYLAMAVAIAALKRKEVSRIILTRPAVEAGEHLGFLPGDLQDKVDPYLRPLYDALYEILGQETYQKLREKGTIEVAPLAYMRGRTLDDSYVILDEAQNTTPEQMKMFLTRLGFNAKAIVTGDVTQVDLPKGRVSGLVKVTKILKNIKGIGFSYLSGKDVVRHPLVQRIIAAYEAHQDRD